MRFALFAFLCALSISGTAAFTLPIRELSTDSNTVNFLTLGDWGSLEDTQKNASILLSTWAGTEDPQFLFSLGDNFYDDGVVSDTDPQWQTKYASVYTSPSLNLPWYVVLGNHDHHDGHGQGEIDYYLNKRDSRWFMPSFWYSASWKVTTGDGQQFTIQGLFIDTVVLIGGDDAPVNQTQADEETEWIVAQLKASTADWLFVSGHYPVYSDGEHGNTDGMVNKFKPLFEQYGVDTYFCGHDHTMQILAENNVHYIVSGNGGKEGELDAQPQKQFIAGFVAPGFGVHYVNSTHLTHRLVGYGTSQIIYTQARNAKPWEQIPRSA